MLRDFRRAFIQIPAGVFERLRHRSVHLYFSFLELRTERDFLCERMLKGILQLGVEGRFE